MGDVVVVVVVVVVIVVTVVDTLRFSNVLLFCFFLLNDLLNNPNFNPPTLLLLSLGIVDAPPAPSQPTIPGEDAPPPPPTPLTLPINTLTWREIARLVFTGCLVKEVGLNEADTQATIRGKGRELTTNINIVNRRELTVSLLIVGNYHCH